MKDINNFFQFTMSLALLAIQNIFQDSNIFNRSRKTVLIMPFGDKKVTRFSGFLPTSMSYLKCRKQEHWARFCKERIETVTTQTHHPPSLDSLTDFNGELYSPFRQGQLKENIQFGEKLFNRQNLCQILLKMATKYRSRKRLDLTNLIIDHLQLRSRATVSLFHKFDVTD